MAHLTSTAANGILLLLSVATGVIAGCAVMYTPIQPMNIPYYNEAPVEGDSNVTVDFKYDILSHSGNPHYAKIESKSNIHLVGLKIKNQGDDTLYFPENFAFYTRNRLIEPLNALETLSKLEQTDNAYRFGKYNDNLTDVDHPLFLILALPLTVNEAVALTEDQSMQKEFEAYYLVGDTILPHATVQGLVALPIDKTTLVRVAKR